MGRHSRLCSPSPLRVQEQRAEEAAPGRTAFLKRLTASLMQQKQLSAQAGVRAGPARRAALMHAPNHVAVKSQRPRRLSIPDSDPQLESELRGAGGLSSSSPLVAARRRRASLDIPTVLPSPPPGAPRLRRLSVALPITGTAQDMASSDSEGVLILEDMPSCQGRVHSFIHDPRIRGPAEDSPGSESRVLPSHMQTPLMLASLSAGGVPASPASVADGGGGRLCLRVAPPGDGKDAGHGHISRRMLPPISTSSGALNQAGVLGETVEDGEGGAVGSPGPRRGGGAHTVSPGAGAQARARRRSMEMGGSSGVGSLSSPIWRTSGFLDLHSSSQGEGGEDGEGALPRLRQHSCINMGASTSANLTLVGRTGSCDSRVMGRPLLVAEEGPQPADAARDNMAWLSRMVGRGLDRVRGR